MKFIEDSKFFWTEYHGGTIKYHHALDEFFIPVLWIDRKECDSRPYRPFPLR